MAAKPGPNKVVPTAPGGNDRKNPPTVDTNPATEPKRQYLGHVTLDNKLEYAMTEAGYDSNKNCFQYVFSNEVESIEISTGACPAAGTLAPWSKVVTTLWFYAPDGNTPDFDIYHASQSAVNLGYLTDDFTDPTSPNPYIYELCNGKYQNTGGPEGGCTFEYNNGVITSLDIQIPD